MNCCAELQCGKENKKKCESTTATNCKILTGLTGSVTGLTGLCISGVCAWGGWASLPSADSRVSGSAASVRSADGDERGKLRRWEGDQGNPTSEQGSNRLRVLVSVEEQVTNRLRVLFSVFQTREQLLTEISRYETRVADLESALKQQGLVTHLQTHTHTHTGMMMLTCTCTVINLSEIINNNNKQMERLQKRGGSLDERRMKSANKQTKTNNMICP